MALLSRVRGQIVAAHLALPHRYERLSHRAGQPQPAYARALENKDVAAIVKVFTADAVWEMPPFTGWYQGPVDIGRLIDTQCPVSPAA